jgi:hypothetical protein
MNENDILIDAENIPADIKKMVLEAASYGAGGLTDEAIATLKARSSYIKPEALATLLGEELPEGNEGAEDLNKFNKDQIIAKLVEAGFVEGEHFKKTDKKSDLIDLLNTIKADEEESEDDETSDDELGGAESNEDEETK